MATTVRVGSRGSLLALKQTEQVLARLRSRHPDLCFETHIIKTQGDEAPTTPLSGFGERGVFVKELENALLSGQIDCAVHSLKDLPTRLPPGLTLAAVPEREEARDALISGAGLTFWQLPPGTAVGTGSPRRASQLRSLRPDLEVVPVRGNLDTRLRKLDRGEFQALVVAACGLQRLGWAERITEYLPLEVCLPAIGQGALAVEARADREDILRLASTLDHPPSRLAVTAERAFLEALGGGCQVPMAAFGQIQDGSLVLEGMVASEDGRRLVRSRVEGPTNSPEELGQRLAQELLEAGAREILGGQAG